MTNLKQIFCSLLGGLLVSATLMAADGWTVRLEHGSLLNGAYSKGLYVDGVSTKGVTRVYINNNNQNLNAIQFTVSGNANLGNYAVTWDPNQIVIDNKANKNYLISDDVIKMQISGGGKTVPTEINPSVDDQLLAEIQYDITDVKAEAVLGFVGTQIISAQRYNPDTDALVNVKSATAFVKSEELEVKAGFNFATKDTAAAETDEDTALTLEATDTELFECTAWDGTALVESTEVEFSAASVATENAGDAAIEDGAIVFTPAENWYGEAVINYTAVSTAQGISASVDGEITVTVKSVYDAPVVSVREADLTFNEGLAFDDAKNSKTLALDVVDVDNVGLASAATLSCGDYVLDVTVADVDQDGIYYVSFDAIATVVSYENVRHPATDTTVADAVLTVAPNLLGAETISVSSIPVKFVDVDQPVKITSFDAEFVGGKQSGSASEGYEVTADTKITLVGTAEDADGDTISDIYAGIPEALVKSNIFSGTYTASTEPYGDGKTVTDTRSIKFTVVNSAPVANKTAYSLFIQKQDGVAGGSTTLTLDATDADGDELSVKQTGAPAGENWVVHTEDLTVTFSTTSAEELTNQTFTFVVRDDEQAQSEEITVTVDFMSNPAPVVVIDKVDAIDEVDENGEATVFEVTATATDNKVYPAGVNEWKMIVPEGWSYELVEGATGSVTEGDWSGTATFKVTTAGYDTIVNANNTRPESAEFDIKVIAVDTFTSAEGMDSSAVMVNDVDRKPTAPTEVTMDPETGAVRDTTLSAQGAGSDDEDGDFNGVYAYSWAYLPEGGDWLPIEGATEAAYVETENVHTYVKKGNQVKAIAKAITKPYGEGNAPVYSEGTEAIWTIGNSAPIFTKVGDNNVPDGPYVWKLTEDTAAELTVVAEDVDVTDGVDSIKYSVSELDETVGTIEIDEESGKITYTPAENYYNGGENMPEVTVTVTDESGDTDTVDIQLNVAGVNDKPVIVGPVDDQYVLPDERGTEMIATFDVDMGNKFEDGQEIAAAEITMVSDPDPDPIFDGVPTLTYEGKTLTLVYKVKENAELGKSATVTFKAQDNDEDNPLWSDEVTVTIFVGASPWYPIISFECEDPEHADGHTFHLEGTDNSVYDLTVKGDKCQLLPADYAAAGIKGYTDDVTVTATIYVWTMEEGTTETVCATKELTVSAYGLPGAASAKEASATVEDGWVTLPVISVPMAQSYTLEVVGEDGNTVQTVKGDFQPNENGMILPNIEGMELQIAKAGDYSVTVTGINPNGEGDPKTEVVTFTVEEDTEAVVEWTDGDFLPADGTILTTDVAKLSWPVATNAESYTVRVYGPDGALQEEATGLTETSYSTTKTKADDEAQNYTWYVSAIRDGEVAAASVFHNFTLSKANKEIIPTTVNKDDDHVIRVAFSGKLEEDSEVTVTCLYYSCGENMWHDNLGVVADYDPNTDPGALHVALSGDTNVTDGDYVVLIIYVDGKQCGEDTAYMVMP